MKKVILLLAASIFVVSCGDKKKEEKKDDGFQMKHTEQKTVTEAPESEVVIDMNNKGVGPITSLEFEDEINMEMVANGEATFNGICIACHQVDKKLIGPPMKGIYERRSPEWVMNMILNPEGMLKDDPIAKALQKEYNGQIMVNQGLSQEEAREVAEFLRSL